MNSRAAAAIILTDVIKHGKKLDEALNTISEDKPFVQVLSYGVCRYYHRLLAIAKQLLDKPLPAKNHDILALLLLGLYQLIYLDTKPFAAVNECVAAAKQLGKPKMGGLVNAILREFQRQQEGLLANAEQHLEAKYSHPRWLIEQLKTAWPQDWQMILINNNRLPPMTLRVNQQCIGRDAYLAKLRDNNIAAVACLYSKIGITLQTPVAVTALPGFAEGEVSVQDEAAQFAPRLLDIQAGQYILDACAAPGGKTCHILETQPNVELLALDHHKTRCQRIQENLNRLQLSAILHTADAARPETWWDGKPFDRILLDAPCSASGVIRRHPDIKLLRKRNDIKALIQTQQQLLKKLWPLLKPGGILLYATCSLLPQENTQVIERFLSHQQDAKMLPITAAWGKATSVGRQILPDDMDGFYYAKLAKRG